MNRHQGSLGEKRVWVSAHASAVGAAIVRRLWRERCEIVLADPSQLDLRRQDEVEAWFRLQRPDLVFLTSQPRDQTGSEATASVLHDELTMNMNVLSAARTGRATVVNMTVGGMAAPLGLTVAEISSARDSGSARMLAKLATIRLTEGYALEHGCRFIAMVSSCVYVPGRSIASVPAALAVVFAGLAEAVRRREGQVEICDDAMPYGLIHVDDLADAALFVASNYAGRVPVHCRLDSGSGLQGATELLAELAGFPGRIVLRSRAEDGGARRIAPVSVGALGWRPEVPFPVRLREIHRAWLRENLVVS
jgi:GDP-L-fucose synthase